MTLLLQLSENVPDNMYLKMVIFVGSKAPRGASLATKEEFGSRMEVKIARSRFRSWPTVTHQMPTFDCMTANVKRQITPYVFKLKISDSKIARFFPLDCPIFYSGICLMEMSQKWCKIFPYK